MKAKVSRDLNDKKMKLLLLWLQEPTASSRGGEGGGGFIKGALGLWGLNRAMQCNGDSGRIEVNKMYS